MRKVFFILLFCFAAVVSQAYAANTPDYFMLYNYDKCNLTVYDEEGVVVAHYKVAMPKIRPKRNIKGRIGKIIKCPPWIPTIRTIMDAYDSRKVYIKDYYPPGHPQNAMGDCKMTLISYTKGVNPSFRFHGTNDPEQIGKKVSRGCIRHLNENILHLADLFKSKLVEFEIVV